LWKGGLFPAEFLYVPRQSSFLFGGGNAYRTMVAAISTNRLISIAYMVFRRKGVD
jgi:hypothetical protein